MPEKFTRRRLTWLAYLLLAFYSYFLNILGPITPFLKEELQLSYTVSGLHFTAFAAGILLVGFGGDLAVWRAGRLRSLWIGASGMSLGALLVITGRTPEVTIGACFFMGLVGSLVLAIVPSVLSDEHGALRAVAISEANVIASLVSTAAPLMVGLFARFPGGWRIALCIAAVMPLLMRLGFRKVNIPQAVSPRQNSAGGQQPLPGRYWVIWLALVLAVSIEFCMVFWSADYLEKSLGTPKVQAAQAVSLFLAAMILGRLAASRLVQKITPRRLVSASILLAGAGFILFWRAGSPLLGMSGLFITGLGVASLYPLILSMAIGSAGDRSVLASARATLASGTAILTLPLVLGRLADAVGIQPAYGVVVLLLLGVFLIVQATGLRGVQRQVG